MKGADMFKLNFNNLKGKMGIFCVNKNLLGSQNIELLLVRFLVYLIKTFFLIA
ncbi:hypothetical protein ACE6H2_023468 [Prunus campanulata]